MMEEVSLLGQLAKGNCIHIYEKENRHFKGFLQKDNW